MKYVQPLTLFQHLLGKRKSGKQAGLLGLDVGDRYVGLAMSDPSHRIATPGGILQRTKTNIDLMASDFQCLIANFSLVGFVVGCPFDRIQETPDGVPIKMFLDNLSRTGKFQDLKFSYWNECFTSKNVHLLITPLDLHPVDEKTILDKVAAAGILGSCKQEDEVGGAIMMFSIVVAGLTWLVLLSYLKTIVPSVLDVHSLLTKKFTKLRDLLVIGMMASDCLNCRKHLNKPKS